MARIYGLNGLIQGRQGNNVFSIQNGTQVLKAYNPSVANPRTLAQQTQRVKFALAGKMSGATPNLALLGLSAAGNRGRRARFVSMLTRIASVTGSLGDLTASIPYQSVIYSEGSTPRYSANPNVTAEFGGTDVNSNVVVTFPRMYLGSIVPQGYGEIAVVALYDTRTSMLDEVQAFERSSSEDTTLTFRQGLRRECFVVAYVNPFIIPTSRGDLSTTPLEGGESVVSLVGSQPSAFSNAEWGVTNYVKKIHVLGTTNAVAPEPDDDRSVVEKKK